MNFRLRPAGLSPKCDSLPLSFPSTGCGFYAAISSDSCTKHKICIWPNFLMHLDRVCKKLQPWFILSLCLSNLSCLLGSWRHLRPTPPSRCVIFPRQWRWGGGGYANCTELSPKWKCHFTGEICACTGLESESIICLSTAAKQCRCRRGPKIVRT